MSLAIWFAAPVFAADSQRWVRRSFMRLPRLAQVRDGMSMGSGGRFPDLLRPFNRDPNIYGIRAFESCRARQYKCSILRRVARTRVALIVSSKSAF
jgi:hypothetical protein